MITNLEEEQTKIEPDKADEEQIQQKYMEN